jgi:hypothetical protein
MEAQLQQRINRAKELLTTVRHGVIATVNPDSSPHNTPVFMAFDEQLNAYWASGPQAEHSQNIARSGQVFIVIFDSVGAGGGLYIRGRAQPLDGKQLQIGLATFNAKRQSLLRETMPMSYFAEGQPQQLYMAHPEQLWINLSRKDDEGRTVQDRRHEIQLSDLDI